MFRRTLGLYLWRILPSISTLAFNPTLNIHDWLCHFCSPWNTSEGLHPRYLSVFINNSLQNESERKIASSRTSLEFRISFYRVYNKCSNTAILCLKFSFATSTISRSEALQIYSTVNTCQSAVNQWAWAALQRFCGYLQEFLYRRDGESSISYHCLNLKEALLPFCYETFDQTKGMLLGLDIFGKNGR